MDNRITQFFVFWMSFEEKKNHCYIKLLFLFFLRYSVKWKQVLLKHPSLLLCSYLQCAELISVCFLPKVYPFLMNIVQAPLPKQKRHQSLRLALKSSFGFVIYFKSSCLKTCLQKDQLQNFMGRHHYLSGINNLTGVITLNSLFCHNCFANNVHKE